MYEDRDIVVLNKPAGLLVHKAPGSEEATLADWIVKKYPETAKVGDAPEIRPGIIHRLDKETSGIMTIARNQSTFDYLKKLFQERKIKKTYIALVWGKVKNKAGVIEKPIGLKGGTSKRTIHVDKAKLVKPAVTAYKVLKFLKLDNEEFSLVQAQPLTGRTHQIRVHFSVIGHPVVGDKLYGKKGDEFYSQLNRHFLHAESLEFTKPDGSRIQIAADLPQELSNFLSNFKSLEE